jgi:predicted MFS family arabinose efflux permease
MREGPRVVGVALLAALAASQVALVVLNPLLPDVARDLDVSVATAGQVRTLSGLTAGLAALSAGLWAARLGLRGLLLLGVATIAAGSIASGVAPDFPVLVVAQMLVGFGIGLSYSAAVAATAEWAPDGERSRVLAIALLGPPLAWIVGMPLIGLLGEVSWRVAWLVIPVSTAAVATALVLRRPATPPAETRAGLRAVFGYPGVVRWSSGELLAFSGWAGALV